MRLFEHSVLNLASSKFHKISWLSVWKMSIALHCQKDGPEGYVYHKMVYEPRSGFGEPLFENMVQQEIEEEIHDAESL